MSYCCQAEQEFYEKHGPRRHAEIARMIEICAMVARRNCTGNGCDVDRHCGRHGRATEVADRYDALRARWAVVAK